MNKRSDSPTVESILSDLIRIQTANPPGGETELAKYLKGLFDRYQIPNEVIEPAPGRGSFLAYLGEGERKLLYLAHADVVPATEGWRFAPFGGEVNNGFVHGRGALDCKGLVAAEAWAVINLALNTKLKGRLIFAATADEETGGTLGVKYLADNCPDKIRADFAINEGGEAPVRIDNKTCHFLGVGEKGIAWLNLRAKGVSAHSSRPLLGDNAVVKMAKAIARLADYQPRITLIPEVKQMVQAIAELQGFRSKVNENNADQVIQKTEKTFAGYLSAITRMTVSPTVVHGGVKRNIVPDSCDSDIDIRVLPGQDKDYVMRELAPLAGDTEMTFVQYHPPTFSSSDSEHYRLVSDILKEFAGDAIILPSISSGATDSRFLRELGIPSYGIEMMTFNLDPAIKQSVHGKDEKLDIESLRMKSEFLVRLAKRYLGG